MNNVITPPSGWLSIKSVVGEGWVKVFRQSSLTSVLAFTRDVMEIVEQASAENTTMLNINAFECIVSLHSATDEPISVKDLQLAEKIDRVAVL